METDDPATNFVSHDVAWTARHRRLDTALTAAIRPPAADERFDEQVWALIRADEADAVAMQEMLRMRLGTPWWLASLNVVAVAVTAAAIALALSASGFFTESAALRWAFVEQPPSSAHALTLAAGAAALWLGLRQVPFVRALA